MEDRPIKLASGTMPLVIAVLVPPVLLGLSILATFAEAPFLIILFAPIGAAWLLSLFGFIIVSPNDAKVIQLFGKYVGTLSDVGFFWGNPFYLATKVSQRIRTFETGMNNNEEVTKDATGKVTTKTGSTSRQPLKVNDKDGVPIDIAAVVVWKVISPAQAVFQVDNYESFVRTQADAALRNLASHYSYDAPESDQHSLRGHIDEVAKQLQTELDGRMRQAGVQMVEARISYLAYAPEIASSMLQRQQASATVAARRIIVQNAVGMVEMALDELTKKQIVEFDPERRAAMVSNLLVVLCSHTNPQPVVNTGTIYS